MSDPAYIRAIYDKDRESYVSEETDWVEDGPRLEYRFTLDEDNGDLKSLKGGLEKLWRDDADNWYGELFLFGEYASVGNFDADVQEIIGKARDISVNKNIDEFLAITDIVKQRAVALDYGDETIEDLEGLFQSGPEDAYILHDIGDGPRLHHHVECDDGCCYLHVAQVVETNQQLLGWGLFAVHLPELASSATESEIQAASHARVLLLDHLHNKRDAKLAMRGFQYYMETERVDNPEYAYMNDTEVIAEAALGAEWNDSTNDVIWQDFTNQPLKDFLNGTTSYVYPREKWQPRDKPLVDRFFKQHPMPIWLEDQMRAAFDEQAEVEPDIDEDGPYNNLDLG